MQVFAMNTLTSTLWCSSSGYKTIAGNRIVGASIVMGAEESTTPNTQISAFIYGNTVTDSNSESASYGIRIDGGANAVFNNTVVNCTHAVSLLGESSSNNIFANRLINNVEGLELFGQGNNNTFHGNYVANNQYGVLVSHTHLRTPGENNTVYRNNFVDNTEQVNTGTTYPGYYDPPVSTFHTGNFDNGEEGNYWSDYNGEDTNSDGIGDTPYVIDASRQDYYPLMAPFDISSISIELPEWAYVSPSPLPSPLPLPSSETMYSGDATADATSPEIKVLSPTNQAYNESSVALVFTVSEQCNWTGCSLDGEENVTVTGNFTLTDLPNGSHNVAVYANDTYGNMSVSETINFTIAVPEPTPEPFPTLPVATASVASIIAVSAGLVYFKRHKH
jgi:nitrous oxidase accessory protein NosD